MPTIILGDIEFTGDDIAAKWIYDNATLAAWYSLAPVDASYDRRPNAHGEYDNDRLYAEGMPISFEGQYYGDSPADADVARTRLAGLFRDGRPILMTVAADDGTQSSRRVNVTGFDPGWNSHGHFAFSLDLHAPDPRRYGALEQLTSGLPSPSTGLSWPLGTTVTSETAYALTESPSGSGLYTPNGLTESPSDSGLYLVTLEEDLYYPGLYYPAGSFTTVTPDPLGPFFDWGTAGDSGQVAVVNGGNAATCPIISVGAGGSFTSGFRVTEIETGRELTYPKGTSDQVVNLMSRTGRALINGGDVTGSMSKRQWFSVPAGEMRRYQVDSLGPVLGTPTYTVSFAPANL